MTGPREWRHAEGCDAREWDCGGAGCRVCRGMPDCSCGLSALREAVASGDPLAVLDVLGLGGALEADECDCGKCEPLYRVVRPLPDTPEVSP